jgi:hypothetical protein
MWDFAYISRQSGVQFFAYGRAALKAMDSEKWNSKKKVFTALNPRGNTKKQ